tara:strand:+ start:338 stop:532 length:195 start_codon:yes stop_codon:yes gene_type:complete
MEKLKSIFASVVASDATVKDLWQARHNLCFLYNPEDSELCMNLDRAIHWIDIKIANLTNEVSNG